MIYKLIYESKNGQPLGPYILYDEENLKHAALPQTTPVQFMGFVTLPLKSQVFWII